MDDSLIAKYPLSLFSVGEMDSFLRENTAFARRLKKYNKLLEFVQYPGATHGFVGIKKHEPIYEDYYNDM